MFCFTAKTVYSYPQIVWYHFRQLMTIGKFSFRNRREPMWKNNNPTRFDFVGTGDEETSDCSKQTWTTIKSVGNVIWNNHDQEKTWFIEEEDRKEFMCFGIRILGITDGGTFAALQDIKMWTGERT